jgi:uncharacterized protein with FMN-binding domain
MRRAVAAVLGAAALALPNAGAWAATQKAASPRIRVVTATKSFTGTTGSAGRWGDVEVTIVVRKTTTTNLKTKKKTVKRKITSVSVPVFPNHTDRSIFINQQALPMLVQETIQAQSATIDMISGATDTSSGFEQSLQSAILTAKSW